MQNNIATEGFTIIELIVVIAIIAILAAIVMVNVVGYISNAKIAGIKSDLSQMNTLATSYAYEHGGSYSGFCNTLTNISDDITAKGRAFTCYDEGNAPSMYTEVFHGKWAAYAYDASINKQLCIDSDGRKNTNGLYIR